MGTHHHQPMAVCIAETEPRQALIPMIIPKTDRKGITSLGILMFILITITLLIMDVDHGIEGLAIFVDCITICLLIARRE